MDWKCLVCGDENIPGNKLLDHMRLFHMGEDVLPESWPDGGPVFYEWD